MYQVFQDSFVLRKYTFSHFREYTYFFFTTVTFLRISFFRTVTSSQLFFFQKSYFSRVKLLLSSHFLKLVSYLAVVYPDHLVDWYTGLGAEALAPKNHFSFWCAKNTSYLFSVVHQQKLRYVAINDFPKHLIIFKQVRRQKYRQKKMGQKMSNQKKKLSTQVFSFIQIRRRSRKCLNFLLKFFKFWSHSLNNVNS